MRFLFPNELRPARYVFKLVILAPESEITVVCRHGGRRGQFLGISDAERDVARLKQPENFLVEPRFVTEFESGADPRQLAQERTQHLRVLFEIGRQLKQDRAESIAE